MYSRIAAAATTFTTTATITSNILVYYYYYCNQGSYVSSVLSAAEAAHCGALRLYLHALYLMSTVYPWASAFHRVVSRGSSSRRIVPTCMNLLFTVPMGISLPPYCTYIIYMQSFNFTSFVFLRYRLVVATVYSVPKYCTYMHWTYCQLNLFGVSLPPYCTYKQSFNFRPVVLSETACRK